MRSLIARVAFVLFAVGCAQPVAQAPCPASPDARTMEIVSSLARAVENLRQRLDTPPPPKEDGRIAVIGLRLDLDTKVRSRMHDVHAAERRIRELSTELLALASSQAEKTRVATALAAIERGQGDRSGASLPKNVKEAPAFASFVENVGKRESLDREVVAIEAQISALDHLLADPSALPSVPASVTGPRAIEPWL